MSTENNHENFDAVPGLGQTRLKAVIDAGQQLRKLGARLRLMSVNSPALGMVEHSTLAMIPISSRTYAALTQAVAAYQTQQNEEQHG